jgi:hypothetical protein
MTMFNDTMFAKIKSRQQNTAAQIFCTQSGWTRAHPLRKEADAHEALSLRAHRDGVPEVLVMDGYKAQTQYEFRRKLLEFDIHVKQLEAYNSKSNAAEGGVRELKRGTGREQLRAKSPKLLWDHCPRRQSYVQSYAALDILSLEWQVPETQVFRNQADISTVAEYAWYEFVKYRYVSVGFPDTNIQLGRDLGPAIDIGPTMAHIILKKNGEITYKTDVRSLTPDELASPDVLRVEYDSAIRHKLGDHYHLQATGMIQTLVVLIWTRQAMTPMRMREILPSPRRIQTMCEKRRLTHTANMLARL